MADKGFNGSTMTWPNTSTNLANVVSMDFAEPMAEVDITDASDTYKTYEAGLRDLEFTVELNGNPAIAVGDPGALAVAWNDGTTDAMGTAKIFEKAVRGEVDGAIRTTLRFKMTE